MTMLVAGICFCLGAVLTAAAYHLPQLVVGRVVLGLGVGESLRLGNFKHKYGVGPEGLGPIPRDTWHDAAWPCFSP